MLEQLLVGLFQNFQNGLETQKQVNLDNKYFLHINKNLLREWLIPKRVFKKLLVMLTQTWLKQFLRSASLI
jgi:hypothetical protein